MKTGEDTRRRFYVFPCCNSYKELGSPEEIQTSAAIGRNRNPSQRTDPIFVLPRRCCQCDQLRETSVHFHRSSCTCIHHRLHTLGPCKPLVRVWFCLTQPCVLQRLPLASHSLTCGCGAHVYAHGLSTDLLHASPAYVG